MDSWLPLGEEDDATVETINCSDAAVTFEVIVRG